MNPTVDLKELERQAYRATFQDGLWDLFLGLMLLATGGMHTLARMGVSQPWPFLPALVPVLLFVIGKRTITIPRMGVATFGPARQGRLRRLRIFLIAAVAVGGALFLLAATGGVGVLLRGEVLGVPVLLIALSAVMWMGLSLWAHFLDFPRLYWIALLFGLSAPLSELLRPLVGATVHYLVGFGITALVVCAVGLAHLIRFVRSHPVPREEVSRA